MSEIDIEPLLRSKLPCLPELTNLLKLRYDRSTKRLPMTTLLLLVGLTGLIWTLIPARLAEGYAVQGRFKARTIAFGGTEFAKLRLKKGRWHVDGPAYPFAHKRSFLTWKGAIKQAIEDHTRARRLGVA
jgi:hypothetical protein